MVWFGIDSSQFEALSSSNVSALKGDTYEASDEDCTTRDITEIMQGIDQGTHEIIKKVVYGI
jgi:hypothetical protein